MRRQPLAAMTAGVASLNDGTIYTSGAGLGVEGKKLSVAVENSGSRKMGK